MKLGLRRTGSVDVDKATRERLTADRRHAKKRAKRAAARAVKVARGTHIDPLPGRTIPKTRTREVDNELTRTKERERATNSAVANPSPEPRGRVASQGDDPSELPAVARDGGLVVSIGVAELSVQIALLTQNHAVMEKNQRWHHQDHDPIRGKHER